MLMHQNVFSFIIIVIVSVEYISECNGYHLIPASYNNLTRFRRQSGCRRGQFACDNEECISIRNYCDGKSDCSDESDEDLNCNTNGCSSNKFQCAYGACVDGDSKCDGKRDCRDNSDEDVKICAEFPDRRGCIVPTIENGNSTISGIAYIPGTIIKESSVITIKCNPGYKLSVNNLPRCTAGVWDIKVPKCRTILLVNGECPSPVIANGKYEILGTDQHVSGDPIPNYSLLTFTCISDNYALTTTNNLVYCIDGKLQNKLPNCVPSCPARFSSSVDVTCELNGVRHDCSKNVPEGTIATMKCKTHYVETVRGQTTAICLRGSWDVPLKQCTPECGELASKTQTIIIDGTEAEKSKFPWHVAIYKRKYNDTIDYICGGSIISERLVLSAAHCFTNPSSGKLYSISDFSVAAGKYFSDWDAPTDKYFVQKRKVSFIEISEEYLGYESNFAGDIAVVVVEEAFVLTDFIKPVCVDWNSQYVDQQLKGGVLGQVPGWGFSGPSKPVLSPYLKELTFPFVELKQCFNTVPKSFRPFITYDKYCAGYTNGTSLCAGDTGGGMVFSQEEFKGKKYYIQGIASVGPVKDGSCDNYQLTGYTKVNSYISFLSNVTSSNEKLYENKKPEECLEPVIQNGNYRVLTTNEFISYSARQFIPNLSIINITCVNTNYVLTTPYSLVHCVQGKYSHEMPRCVLTCSPQFSISIDVDCKLDGINQDCTKDVRAGTIAYMKCKPNYIDNSPEISNTTCTENGVWDAPTKQCSSPYMCPPRLSTAVDIFCELNGVRQDCSKEVPDGTTSRMICKKNYIDVNDGPSIAFCSNGTWSIPPKKCIPDCGQSQITSNGQTYIINGTSANRGDFAWHVAIYRQKPQEPLVYKCGGSIISVKIVISAAHCFTDDNNGNLYPVSEFLIAAGKKYSKWDASEDEYYVQKRNVTKIHTPRDVYFGQLSTYAGDVAVVVVDKLFTFTNFIKPVCVDWNSEYVDQQLINGMLGNIVGWGSTTTWNPIESVNLKQLTIPFVRRDQCVEIVPKYFIPFVTVDKYCAGYTNGSSVCGGDSGGSMVFPHRNDYEIIKYYLQGIISAGPTKDGNCDDYQLGVYTKVSNYITFIRDVEESNRV